MNKELAGQMKHLQTEQASLQSADSQLESQVQKLQPKLQMRPELREECILQHCRTSTGKGIFHLGIEEKLPEVCGNVSHARPREDARDLGNKQGDRCLPSELLSSRRKRLQQVAWQPWELRGALASWENSHDAGNSGSSCSDTSAFPRPPLVWLLKEQSPEDVGQPEPQVPARRLTHHYPGWDRVPAWAFSPSKSSWLSSF